MDLTEQMLLIPLTEKKSCQLDITNGIVVY